MIAKTPKAPYYAVIFTSIKSDNIDEQYNETSKRMLELASEQSGFLGLESASGELGITVSYWKDLESIKEWKYNTEHRLAQEEGKSKWYKEFKTRITKVERDYEFAIL